MTEEKVFFTNADGLTLCGILEEAKKPNGVCILLCHGFSVDKDEGGVHADVSHELVERGFSVFRFDFRAHGESEGDSRDLTVLGEVQDIATAVVYLQERGFTHIGIMAQSFSAGPTLLYASEHPDFFTGIVLWNGLIDYEGLLHPEKAGSAWMKTFAGESARESMQKQGYVAVGKSKYKVGAELVGQLTRLHPWQELDRITTPILFVHGTADTVVPYEQSLKYSRMFNLPLVTIDGGEHGFADNYSHELQATHATIDFFEEHLV